MEDSGDIRGIAAEPASRWFAPERLRPVHQLNRRLLSILIDESKKSAPESNLGMLGAQLSRVGDPGLERLAAIPLSLLDAGFQQDEIWHAVADGNRQEGTKVLESPLPRARALELGALTFDLASNTARESQESARLIFGMSASVASAFAGFSLDVVHWLGQARAHWIRPRWHAQPAIWKRLIETTEHSQSARLAPVGMRAMNRLLADLEAATRADSETRRSRR